MITSRRFVFHLSASLIVGAMLALAPTHAAHAYKLKTACSQTGTEFEKWDTSRPIQVRLLAPSATWMFDRYDQRYDADDIVKLDRDIRTVIDLYNAIPGTTLNLELGPGIMTSSDLAEPEDVNHGNQTIVIGFAKREFSEKNPNPEAWASATRDLERLVDACTRTRTHLVFRKKVKWTFGPPPHLDVDGRHFNPGDRPDAEGFHSFLGILVHEMGHALGLSHPEDEYAVMAQSFRTWFRSTDHAIAPGLLPDDIAGIRALYGDTSQSNHVDISLTNSWVKRADQIVVNCSTEESEAQAAQLAWFNAIAARRTGTAAFVQVTREFADAVDALERCQDSANAVQVDNCKVSSRADIWQDKIAGLKDCAVRETGSSYPEVSNDVCPGDDLQVRYTLNNHAADRDILARMRMWLSRDTILNVQDGRAEEIQSPDTREFKIRGGKSALLGHVFQVPAEAEEGRRYRVFIRALPFDPTSEALLSAQDTDLWNNAVMVRKTINIKTGC